MAYTTLSAITRYIGKSSDAKPTPSGIAVLFETDTGRTYLYDGHSWISGAWQGAFNTIQTVSVDSSSVIGLTPMVDVDTTFSYDVNGDIDEIVQTYGSQTKTLTLTYTDRVLQSIACVIT
jgi:hypothetical protein